MTSNESETSLGRGRLLGLDVGTKTIGVAVSDPLGLTAQGRGVIRRRSKKADFEQIAQLVELCQVQTIVVGYPVTLSGRVGGMAQAVDEFVAGLAGLGIPVVREDERFTTKIAQQVLIMGDVSRSKRREVIDQQAAVLILQGYLDRLCHGKTRAAVENQAPDEKGAQQ